MRRPRIEDVAAHAGVSRAAVSKVIRNAYGVSPAMRARVEAAIAELGYRPQASARALGGASYTIGVESPALIGTDFLSTIINGAAQTIAQSGYDLIALPVQNVWDSALALQRLIDRPVDGVISLGTIVASSELRQMAEQVPIVAIGRHERSDAFDTVCTDDANGAVLAVDHLRNLGHARIAHVTLALPNSLDTAVDGHEVRERAYAAHMLAQGLTPLVAHVDPADPRAGVKAFLTDHLDEVTAVFAGNDGLALDVLAVLREAGPAAASISVIGYDAAPITAHPLIRLTSIDQAGFQMGEDAAAALLGRLKGRAEPLHLRRAPTLRPGETAFAPASAPAVK